MSTSSVFDINTNIDSPIPTGSWTLYFHSPEETKWTLNTFISLGSMKKWEDFWITIDALTTESLSDGMFFMMRDPSPPLWESHQNIRGGCYSFRCQKKDASDIYLNHIIGAMIGLLNISIDNRINGISISPKRGFNIVKIWNTDAQKYNVPANINTQISNVREGDIIYTPFVQKKM
jgi:hypothetical protein